MYDNCFNSLLRRKTAKNSKSTGTANGLSETTPLIKKKVDSLDIDYKPPTVTNSAKEKETSFQNGVPSPFSGPEKHLNGPGRGRGSGGDGFQNGRNATLGGGMDGRGSGDPSRRGIPNGGGRGGGAGGRGGGAGGRGGAGRGGRTAFSTGGVDKNTVRPSLFRILVSTFWAQFLVTQVLMLVYTLLQFVNPNVLR